MYKRDYHPDENIVFKTKNYGFASPKSTGLEPLSNALVQIDAALKKEETERIAEDIRIDARVSKEITDRESADAEILRKCLKISNHHIKIGYENEKKAIFNCFSIENHYYALFFITAPNKESKYVIGVPTFAKNVEIPSAIIRQGANLLPFQFNRAAELDDTEFYYYRSDATVIPDRTGYRTSLVIHFTL